MFTFKTRAALINSIFVMLIVVLVFTLLYLSLTYNIFKLPIVEKIYPEGVYVTIHEFTENSSLGTNLPKLEKVNIDAVKLNNLILNEISKRLIIVSFFTFFIVLAIILVLNRFLSSLTIKPLKVVTKAINKLSPENLSLNIDINDFNSEDEITKLVTAYNNVVKKLNKAFFDLEQFNSYASHELRNSLAILKSKIELGSCNKELNIYIDKLKETVNDMLILAARSMENNTEEVDLAMITAKAVDEYSLTGRDIKLSIPEEGVSLIVGNENWLYRCIANLLDNAIKYSDTDTPIYVTVKEQDNAVILTVKDFGVGISQDYQQHIWQPYYSINTEKNIHGLGLALINNVVDLFGGMVWVNSKVDQGTTFYVTLPVSLS